MTSSDVPNWRGHFKLYEEEDRSESANRMKSMLCWLPIFLVLSAAIAFISGYLIAVFKGDVNPLWPYISDTGTDPPESCIFGQFLNLAAFLALASMYVRYKLVQAFNSHDTGLKILNSVALAFGILSAFGVSLVANFQESNVIVVHIIGAFFAFGLGVVYCFLHSAITRKMWPMYNSYRIWVIRFGISLLGAVSFVMTLVFGTIASNAIHDLNGFKSEIWNSTEPGYDAHVVSTASEWMIGIAFLAYFLTYVKDFQKITMRILPELLVSHLDEVPIVFSSGPTERTGLLA